jgi:hypothetical protein
MIGSFYFSLTSRASLSLSLSRDTLLLSHRWTVNLGTAEADLFISLSITVGAQLAGSSGATT